MPPHAHNSTRLILRCAAAVACLGPLTWAQYAGPTSENRFRTTAGRHITLPQSIGAKDGARAAGTTRDKYEVTTDPPLEFGMSVNWDVDGNGPLLVVPVTTPPGRYRVTVIPSETTVGQDKQELQIQVDPLHLLEASEGRTPVILLNGWQPPGGFLFLDSCPVSESSETFGTMKEYLQRDLGVDVRFFDNCAFNGGCRGELIGGCGVALGRFISSLSSNPSQQFDLVAHSMGGLIARSYLAGKSAVPGSFDPPLNHRIRKLVTIGTPHFGSYAAMGSPGSTQSGQMIPGTQFLWDLATWNQGWDDLRGVDAISVAGSGGESNEPPGEGSNDGIVSLMSASMGFIAPFLPGGVDERTRIVPYCHATPGWLTVYYGCKSSQGVADINNEQHPTYKIVRSFLQGNEDWKSPSWSTTPQTEPRGYLSTLGGVHLGIKDESDRYLLYSTAKLGTASLRLGPDSSVYFHEYLPAQTKQLFLNGTYAADVTLPAGRTTQLLLKYGPVIRYAHSPVMGPGLTIIAGSTITIHGSGFGLQSSASRVLTDIGELPIGSWSEASITVVLPGYYASSYPGLRRLTVVNAIGRHTVNIFVQPQLPPQLNITKIHTGNFTQGQQGAVYTVSVSNAASAGPTTSQITVTEALPVGLSLVSMTGPGWSCASTTCSRSDALSPGYTYPPITVIVNVAQDAPAQVTNRVTVSGGGSAQATALDTTSINISQVNLNPVISSINPASASAGSAGLTLTVTGTNFTAGAVIRWTSNAITTNLVTQSPNATTLTGYVPSNLLATPGTALVTVANPTGQTSTGTTFTIQQAAPTYPNRYLLSQVAAGDGWSTTFNLINPSKASVSYQLRLKDNAANPLSLTLGGITSSLFAGTLAPGAAVTFTSEQAAALAQGMGQVDASAPLIASGIFTSRVQNRPDYEAAVPSLVAPAKSLILPFDNKDGKATGVAIANTGDAGVNVTFEFRSETGAPINTGSLELGAGEKTQFSLTDRFPQAGGQRGTVLMKASTFSLAALGLRFLPGGTFTTLPVHSPDPATPAIQRQVLSHVVDGAGWLSTITLLNLDSTPAPYQLRLYDRNGRPMTLSLDGALNSTCVGVIPPLTSVTLTTPGTSSSLLEGWADLTSSNRIRAQLMFDQVLPNSPVFEAAVPAIGDGHTALATPFDNTNGLVTSMAVANSGGSATTVQLTVRDENGTVMAVQTLNLGAGEKTAFELTKLVPSSAGRRGLVTITSQGSSISALALRFNGPAFTTLPVSGVDAVTGVPK